MVWACFSDAKVGLLIVYNPGRFNPDRNLEILENGTVTFIEEHLTASDDSDTIEVTTLDAYLFMHDIASCHTASKFTNYSKQRLI